MPTRRGKIDGLWPGALVSLLLHAAAIPIAMEVSRSEPERRGASEGPPHRPVEPDPMDRLGIDRSRHATINWLGFRDPTPHKAVPSDIEQAALVKEAVGRPDPNPAPPTPPAEASEAETGGGESEAEAEQPEPRPVEEPETPRVRPPPAGPDLPSEDPWLDAAHPEGFLPEPGERESPSEPRQAEASPGPAEKPAPDAAEPVEPARQAAPAGSEDLPGEISDRESPPTAEEIAMSLDDWGRPAAGEGIEVMPARPRWSSTTLTLAWPRNPTVVIEFGSDGRVRDARFAREAGKTLDTGSAAVNRELINTLYNWRAKGAKIEGLNESGAGSRLAIRMHIRLRW